MPLFHWCKLALLLETDFFQKIKNFISYQCCLHFMREIFSILCLHSSFLQNGSVFLLSKQWLPCSAKAGGEFLGMREMICASEWMPITLGGSHADYKLCRKDLVDSVNSAASVTAVSSSSQSLLAKLLELVSSLNLVTEDFPCFPFPLREKKKLEINSKVTHFKCSKANKQKLRCSQNN